MSRITEHMTVWTYLILAVLSMFVLAWLIWNAPRK